jgi:diguanylate cyclase (GGDEF)-like protein/PAS domain S-box-containing protein
LKLPSTLRSRLVLAFALMQVLAVSLLGFFLVHQAARTEIETQHSLARNLMALAEPNVQRLLTSRHADGLKQYLDNLITNTAVAGVFVSNPTGTLIYSLDQNEPPPDLLTRLFVDKDEVNVVLESALFENGVSRGSFEIKLSSQPISERLNSIFINSLLILVGLLFLTLLITYWTISRFTAPLKRLVKIASHLGSGDWQQHIVTPKTGYREIQTLGNALTEGARLMAEQITNLENTQEKLRSSEQQLRSLVNNMREALFELDANGDISFLNPAWQQITGYSTTDSFGRNFADFLAEPDDRKLFLAENLPELDISNYEMEICSANNNAIRVEVDAHTTFDPHGKIIGVVGRFQDISERFELGQTLEEHRHQLYRISITDELTGLFNRRHFEKILAQKLPQSLEQNRSLCLALIDVDGFKFINDTYGHPVGDKVLKIIANLLRSMVRPNDMVARLAGDEFALLLADTGIDEARDICTALLDSINNTRVRLTVGHLQLRASIGISVAPFHGSNVQELIGAADVALYHAKRRHRGHIEVLSTDLSQGIMEVFSRGFELRNAIENGDIEPTFQPINILGTGQPMAYEVLANMRRGEMMLPASQFIMVAEDLGLVREIDLCVIEKALKQAPSDVELFMNISLLSFHDSNFGGELLRLLEPACKAGRPVTIEVTERETISLTDKLLQDIQALRDIGCKLALDDFGQGYSTYDYLRRFRPEYLKIDGSFVKKILDSEADRTIIEHIHSLTQSFGAVSIAESLENEAIREAVMKLGIRCGQGYYYGRPDTADKIFTKTGTAA